MRAPPLPASEAFPWPETAARIDRLRAAGPLAPEPGTGWYAQRDAAGTLRAALRPPFLLLADGALPPAGALAAASRAGPGGYAFLLLQAGAAALGRFEDGALLAHKTFKRYVVRGTGRAQPTHLRTRGKSRYGSRLRLANARRLLGEVGDRLARWWAGAPAPTRLFVSCPPRLLADLCRVHPVPPLGAGDVPRVRIPLDVHVPGHAELLRVHRSLSRGRVWWRAGEAPRTAAPVA